MARAAVRTGAWLVAFAVPATLDAQAPAVPALTGVWQAVRVNGDTLPTTDRVVGADGLTHAVRLHDMTIRLRPNGRFQAELRYQRAVLSSNERLDRVPLYTDTWIGAYSRTGAAMRFDPEPRAGQQVQPFTGSVAGARITVDFVYEIVTRKRYVLALDRNDRIW